MKKTFLIFGIIFLISSCTKRNKSSDDSYRVQPQSDNNESGIITIKNVNFLLEDEYTIENSYMIEDYLTAFTELSPEIIERSPETEYIKCCLIDISEDNELYSELGWTKTIEIAIKIKETTNFPKDWDIDGKTLLYYLGSGRVPGVLVETRQEHLFSGFVNEKIVVVTDTIFTGIDEIDTPTFIKHTAMVKTANFRNSFQNKFSEYGGRMLNKWAGTHVLNIESNLRLYFGYVDDDDYIHNATISYDDTSTDLEHPKDYYFAVCAMVSIFEPYLEQQQVEQLAKSISEWEHGERFWLPSGDTYNIIFEKNKMRLLYNYRWGL
ncbi:MAG: hypothetical protein LBT24_06965 [Tannerella sp.]|jgi:hypothetical protein|nr:hypothetical protein [Tannerella sp.]